MYTLYDDEKNKYSLTNKIKNTITVECTLELLYLRISDP